MRGKSRVSVLLSWVVAWTLWLVFANSTNIREILAGAAVSLASIQFTEQFRKRTRQRYILRWRYLRQMARVPAVVVSDTCILLRTVGLLALGKKVPSGLAAARFKLGGTTPNARGRRALAITCFTLTPNTIVLGFDARRKLLLFHTLMRQPLPRFQEVLGASSGNSD